MKPTRNILLWMVLPASILALSQCSNTESRAYQVIPPFQQLDVAYEAHVIDPTQGGQVTLENGTRITIPANAFVDAESNVVNEPVEIKYREFHNPAEIIASGIPMKYDSGGTAYDFQSAGMFEIGAYAESAGELKVASGKSLQVQMASFRDGNDFSFYRFDKGQGNWDYLGTSQASANEEKAEAIKALEAKLPEAPMLPELAQANRQMFDLDVNYTQYPELKPLSGLMWQYAGNDDKLDPGKNPSLFSYDWQNVQLNPIAGKRGVYKLVLEAPDKRFTTEVCPVMSEKDREAAERKLAQKMASYEQVKEGIVVERARMERQADLLRSFQLQEMGIYNWDRVYKQPDVVKVPADFEFEQEVDKSKVSIFLVCGRDVVKYDYYSWSNFNFDPKENNRMLAVLPGDKVAIFTQDDFRKLDLSQLRQSSKHTFRLRTMEQKMASVDQLQSLLERI